MTATKDKKYIEGVGRRKEAVSRVRIYPGTKGGLTVNDRERDDFFKTDALRHMAIRPLETLGITLGSLLITATVKGGGIKSQAEAVSLALARALVKEDLDRRVTVKKAGLLSVDARIKERKKFGLKKARKSPQWSKR